MHGDCHIHMLMDGKNYRKAAALHREGVQDMDLREKFAQYTSRGITFLRDGGDALGVSRRAAQIAPEYGITYLTPEFAIHRKGHYGGIVGRAYEDWKDYHMLVKEVKESGGNFIKLMFSGIMDFSQEGKLTEAPLPTDEIRELIHIAHEEGFAVMAHVNGAQAVKSAAEAGVDSVEHGNFVDEECLYAMAEYGTIWVPTFVTITNLIGSGRFDDEALARLRSRQGAMIRRGFELGVCIGLGSDAGAFCVPHGQGALDEYREFQRILDIDTGEKGKTGTDALGMQREMGAESVMTRQELDERLSEAETKIAERFSRSIQTD